MQSAGDSANLRAVKRKQKVTESVSDYLSRIGRLGGKAGRGDAKRKGAAAKWAKERAQQAAAAA